MMQDVKMLAVEAAGLGLASGKHAASLAGGKPGVLTWQQNIFIAIKNWSN